MFGMFISSQDISSNKFTYFFQKWTLRQVFLWLANGVNHVVPQFVKWQKISSNVKKNKAQDWTFITILKGFNGNVKIILLVTQKCSLVATKITAVQRLHTVVTSLSQF